MIFRVIPFFSLLLLISSCSIHTPEYSGTPTPSDKTEELNTQQKKEFLILVNKIRTQGCVCGSRQMPPVQPVTLQANLIEAANNHALDMYRKNYFNHKSPDGSTVGKRLMQTGYNWSFVGENIASGHNSVQHVFEGWLNSKGHCQNMMNGNYTHLGIAKKDALWVNTFAHPKNS